MRTLFDLSIAIQAAKDNASTLPELSDYGSLRELNKDKAMYATCRMSQGGQGHMTMLAKMHRAAAKGVDEFTLFINIGNPNLLDFLSCAVLRGLPDVCIVLVRDPK